MFLNTITPSESSTRNLKRDERMKKEYDFSKAKRGVALPTTGKTRITLYLDNEVLEHCVALEENPKDQQT